MENTNVVQPWKGFRDFVVEKKVMENHEISTLYLKPVDGEKVVMPKAGQFVTIKITSGNETYDVTRAYSLSNEPNDEYYRVTIRRVEDGRASVYLTDVVKEGDVLGLRPPVGRFFFKEENVDRPVVFIGAGIGITPVLSMVHVAVKNRKNIKYVEIFRNSEFQVLHEEVVDYANDGLIDNIIFYTRPLEKDQFGKDYQVKGYLTDEWIKENLPKDAEYYFCGPREFMKSTEASLLELGVSQEDINYEFF